ncbi:hypothetical protein F8M41_026544 [Gigaspora margarita]|uniref:Uncharacterized protein n=1 Tax=Gigaspora margarita TaxID=4874 RepID=A0A8H3XGS7_GIGMA|nr:hypothetical protein F8M41_026544 [Gigaspora margarita]
MLNNRCCNNFDVDPVESIELSDLKARIEDQVPAVENEKAFEVTAEHVVLIVQNKCKVFTYYEDRKEIVKEKWFP